MFYMTNKNKVYNFNVDKKNPIWLAEYVSAKSFADMLMIPNTAVKEYIYLEHIPFKYFRNHLYVRKTILKQQLYIMEEIRYERFLARDDIPISKGDLIRQRIAYENNDIPYYKWLFEWGFDYQGIDRECTKRDKKKGKVLRDLTDI